MFQTISVVAFVEVEGHKVCTMEVVPGLSIVLQETGVCQVGVSSVDVE